MISPDFAALSQIQPRRFRGFRDATRISYELQNARTDVLGSGNQGEKILQSHEEGSSWWGHGTGAGPRCLAGPGCLAGSRCLEGGFAPDFAQASRVVSRCLCRFCSDFAADFAVVSQDFAVISQGFTGASHVKRSGWERGVRVGTPIETTSQKNEKTQ